MNRDPLKLDALHVSITLEEILDDLRYPAKQRDRVHPASNHRRRARKRSS